MHFFAVGFLSLKFDFPPPSQISNLKSSYPTRFCFLRVLMPFSVASVFELCCVSLWSELNLIHTSTPACCEIRHCRMPIRRPPITNHQPPITVFLTQNREPASRPSSSRKWKSTGLRWAPRNSTRAHSNAGSLLAVPAPASDGVPAAPARRLRTIHKLLPRFARIFARAGVSFSRRRLPFLAAERTAHPFASLGASRGTPGPRRQTVPRFRALPPTRAAASPPESAGESQTESARHSRSIPARGRSQAARNNSPASSTA